MVFGIGYGDDIDKARNIITDVLFKDARVLKDPPIQVAVSELADSSVNFVARAWVNAGDYWGVVCDATETIKKRFDAEGVSIPFPQRDVHIYEHKAG
jgi:small conductance mechanosensitive channel